jgi:cell division septation protein DedD
MMVQPVLSRTQRRIERKQLMLIVVLIIAVAAVSFSLGVMFGKRNVSSQELVAEVDSSTPAKVTQIVPPPPPQEETVPEKPERLTFYDNLPKGNQAPLGSGINLPPEQPKKAVQAKPKRVVKQTEVKTAAATPKQATLPTVSAAGSFVVQVASFRTGEDARALAARLKLYKLSTFIETADLGDKGVWYRVLAGPYKSREEADTAAALLKEKERLSALVRKR